jgi:hypothetical protein
MSDFLRSARRIVFLDVDGVLNSRRHLLDCASPGGGLGMAAVHVSELARILRWTRAGVVVSSTWRKFGLHSESKFVKEMRRHGADGQLVLSRVLGRTVDGYAVGLERDAAGRVLRGTEIQAYVDMVGCIDSFVVLDDDSDMGPVMHRLVQTTFDDGLTPELADKAIEMLGVDGG